MGTYILQIVRMIVLRYFQLMAHSWQNITGRKALVVLSASLQVSRSTAEDSYT